MSRMCVCQAEENVMNNIMMVRLINGEELIAKVQLGNDMLQIIKPAGIMMHGEPSTGRAQMGLVDYLPMAAMKEISLHVSKILFTYAPMPDVENAYNSMFGSGLVVPSKLILTP